MNCGTLSPQSSVLSPALIAMLDDELVIETPERVELHYVLANIGNRFIAAGIDHLIQTVTRDCNPCRRRV